MTKLYGVSGIERVKSIKASFKSILDSIMFPESLYFFKSHSEGFNLDVDKYSELLGQSLESRQLLIEEQKLNLTGTDEFFLNSEFSAPTYAHA